MRLLVAVAVTAWVMPPPMNIPREGSYWQCLSDSCEVATDFVTRETKPKIKQNSVLKNCKLFKKQNMGIYCIRAYFILQIH